MHSALHQWTADSNIFFTDKLHICLLKPAAWASWYYHFHRLFFRQIHHWDKAEHMSSPKSTLSTINSHGCLCIHFYYFYRNSGLYGGFYYNIRLYGQELGFTLERNITSNFIWLGYCYEKLWYSCAKTRTVGLGFLVNKEWFNTLNIKRMHVLISSVTYVKVSDTL